MPECPICEKEFELRGSTSYSLHVQTKHPLYWAKTKRLRQIATVNLVISLFLTFLLLFFFYSPNEMGYLVMGLAALFMAISASFSLRERRLGKSYRKKDLRKGESRKLEYGRKKSDDPERNR